MAKKIISKASSGRPAQQSDYHHPHCKNFPKSAPNHVNMGYSATMRPAATMMAVRNFRSETNLAGGGGGQPRYSQYLPSELQYQPQVNHHQLVQQHANGFIPIQVPLDHQPGRHSPDGVTVFKTKVLYHNKSDFRSNGLGPEPPTGSNQFEQEANV